MSRDPAERPLSRQDPGKAGPGESRRTAPGRATRTGHLTSTKGSAVQRKATTAGAGTLRPEVDTASSWLTNPWMDAAHRGTTPPSVQRMASGSATASNITEVAADGVSGSGQDLPHKAAIQRSFGDHDLGGVRAFVGGAGGAAAEAIGARSRRSTWRSPRA